MKKYIIFAFIFVCLLVFSVDNVFACTCATPKFEDEYKRTTMIFSGKVISVETEKSRRKIKVEIEKLWKGTLPKIVTISLPPDDMPCSFSGFTLKEKYLFYPIGENVNSLSMPLCSRTTRLSGAKGDIKSLKSFQLKNAQN